jgi:hypothetical protein
MSVADGNDLIGVGFAPEQATLVGAVPNKLNGAAATAQTGAALIISRNTELNPAAVTTNSFVFPSTAKLFNPYFFINSSTSVPGFVFVPSGHTLVTAGATTANGSVSVGVEASVIMWQYKSKFWTSK